MGSIDTRKPNLAGSAFFWVIGIGVLLYALHVTAEKKPERRTILVTASDYGGDWPFPFDRGVLYCVHNSLVVLKADDREYGINGRAKVAGYADPSAFQTRDQFTGGFLDGIKTLNDFIDRGLTLCE